MTARRERGATLLEIMITLAIILVGMLGLLRVVTTASQAGASAQHFLQARARAQHVMEAILAAPSPVLDCLASTPVASWANCEQSCRASYGLPPPPISCPPPAGALLPSPACIFSSLCYLRLDGDVTQQQYSLVVDAAFPTRSTYVKPPPGAGSGRFFLIYVSVGWNDDGTAQADATSVFPQKPDHRVTLESGVFK